MRKTHWLLGRRGVALLLTVLCLLGGASGAGAFQVTPLDEMEGLTIYPLEFGDSGITLMIPALFGRVNTFVDGEKYKQLGAYTDAGEEAPFFLISGVRYESLREKPLEDLDTLDLGPIFLDIVGLFDKMELDYVEDYTEGLPAMLVTVSGDNAIRHVAGIREDWLMVLSLYPGTETSEMNRLEEYEQVLFKYMMQPYNFLPTVETIELPDSDLVLALPEGMNATVDRYDEITEEERVLYFISPPAPDDRIELMILTTVRREEFEGKKLHELPNETLSEVAGRFYVGVGEMENDWLRTNDEYPILLLREIGYSSEEHKNDDAYHLVVIKDGWLLGLTAFDMDIYWPGDKLLTAQLHFLESMLAGDGQAPSLEPDSLAHDTVEGRLEIDIPYGYALSPRQVEEGIAQYVLLNMQDGQGYVMTLQTNAKHQGKTIEGQLEDLKAFAKEMEEQDGDPIAVELVEEGMLGVPAVWLRAESGTYTRVFCAVDGCMIDLGNTFTGAPISDADIERMLEMVRFVPGKE